MMTINKKYIYAAALVVMGLGVMASCSDKDDYQPADKFDVPPVFFAIQAPRDIALGSNDSQISFTVLRSGTSGAQSFSLTWEGDYTPFKTPSSVSFADGSSTATATITFDINDVVEGYTYNFTAVLPESSDTPYTENSLDFVVLLTPWKDLGKAVYYDQFFGYWFGIGGEAYEVEVFEHPSIKGLYKLEDPYGEAYPYNEPGDYDAEVVKFMYINASDPNNVYTSDDSGNPAFYYSTMDWGYGAFSMATMNAYYLSNNRPDLVVPANNPFLKNGVIYLPNTNSGLKSMADYNDGALYLLSFSGSNVPWVILPGGVLDEGDDEEEEDDDDDTWNYITSGVYTYLTDMWGEDDGDIITDVLDLYESEENPGKFKLDNWMGENYPLIFTVDEGDNITVPEQKTGVNSQYGMIYISDMNLYTETTDFPSYFEEGIYYFDVVYYVSAGYFATGYETFQPTQDNTRSLHKVNPFTPSKKAFDAFSSRRNISYNRSHPAPSKRL